MINGTLWPVAFRFRTIRAQATATVTESLRPQRAAVDGRRAGREGRAGEGMEKGNTTDRH